jgi:hypothetical protein
VSVLVLSFLFTVLLLAAAIVGLVWALVSASQRRRRRGLLVGSIVVGVLALTSAALTLPALIDSVHMKVTVIVITPGATP